MELDPPVIKHTPEIKNYSVSMRMQSEVMVRLGFIFASLCHRESSVIEAYAGMSAPGS